MDQDAFRNLLASGSASSSSDKSKSRSRGVLGAPPPKRTAWGIKARPGNEYKPPADESRPSTAFAPRSQKKKDPTAGKYVDRAELRRQGKEDEYKPVEQLLEVLEKRQKEEGVEQEEIDKQRAYLGGDATHSILVKGLDYALLARTRAELAAKGEQVADEELEELVRGAQGKKAEKVEQKQPEEKMAKGFKSIASKGEQGVNGEKKKKKKKKAVKEEPGPDVSAPREQAAPVARPPQPDVKVEAGPSKVVKKEPTPPPIDDDDDIFGDAGGYDLTAGREDEDDSATDDEAGEVAQDQVRQRSPQTVSFSRPIRRPKSSRSRDRYSRRDEYYRRSSRQSRSYRDDRGERHVPRGRRERSYSRDRYQSYSSSRYRSPSPRRSPSPVHRTRERSRSASPPPKRARQKTRSPSPLHFDFNGRAPSPTPSEESGDDHLVGGKLQPLRSSALSDVKGYLSADAQAAKDEERRARKAKWRARQGLALQEGSEKFLERQVGEKEKANRDYVNIMNKVKKVEGAGEGAGEG
ncbi:hypothetical protein DB88DRAFT_511908 [Papiliotrema laurentii]|uniref:RED-like N-terminal domain-containing protein n=1 Tax=Papiliotrema laurentii TaxID=5418 RepID=A0AAD9CXM3_PAPLA|nr:hypothetical protein DB88DRAFT_511908 [Papiliotrema laurentii]